MATIDVHYCNSCGKEFRSLDPGLCADCQRAANEKTQKELDITREKYADSMATDPDSCRELAKELFDLSKRIEKLEKTSSRIMHSGPIRYGW